MIYYIFEGKDSDSDAGYWIAIINSGNVIAARQVLRKYLEEMDRSDLIPTIKLLRRVKSEADILFSTVERKV